MNISTDMARRPFQTFLRFKLNKNSAAACNKKRVNVVVTEVYFVNSYDEKATKIHFCL